MRVAAQFVCALVLGGVGSVNASTFTFNTPTGATDLGAGNPISASAIFTVSSINGGTNNELTITLTNKETDTAEDGQILDALTFQLKNQDFNAGATITTTASITEAITIGSYGSYSTESKCNGGSRESLCGNYVEDWTTSTTVAGTTATFDLCDAQIANLGCTGAYSNNDEGIIGAPGAHGSYDQASSYRSSSQYLGSYDPYVYETITFTAKLSSGGGSFYIPNNYASVFANVDNSDDDPVFGFGQDGATVEAANAPEPGTLALMMGLAGLLAFRYRRRIFSR